MDSHRPGVTDVVHIGLVVEDLDETVRFLALFGFDCGEPGMFGGECVANGTVAILRSAAGRDPYDRDLSDLVGELATQSAAFRTRWASHNVRFHNTGVKRFNPPVVGELRSEEHT